MCVVYVVNLIEKTSVIPSERGKNNLIGTWKCHTVGSVQAGDREGIFSTEFICIFIRKLFATKCNMHCRLQCLPSLPISNFYITLSSYLCLVSAFCFSSPFIWEREKKAEQQQQKPLSKWLYIWKKTLHLQVFLFDLRLVKAIVSPLVKLFNFLFSFL